VAASNAGTAQFVGIPYGARTIEILQGDFEPFTQTTSVGWLSSNTFAYQLRPKVTSLLIRTNPDAQVSLNGQPAGNANQQGVFMKEGVNAGVYEIEVSLPGFTTWREKLHLGSPRSEFWAGLNISRERQQQMEAQQQQAQQNRVRFEQLLNTAQGQFRARQYKPALASVDEALKLQPNEPRAERLRSQIQQTMSILK
jgi:hypothetical protein